MLLIRYIAPLKQWFTLKEIDLKSITYTEKNTIVTVETKEEMNDFQLHSFLTEFDISVYEKTGNCIKYTTLISAKKIITQYDTRTAMVLKTFPSINHLISEFPHLKRSDIFSAIQSGDEAYGFLWGVEGSIIKPKPIKRVSWYRGSGQGKVVYFKTLKEAAVYMTTTVLIIARAVSHRKPLKSVVWTLVDESEVSK